jgi:hypothetical protein
MNEKTWIVPFNISSNSTPMILKRIYLNIYLIIMDFGLIHIITSIFVINTGNITVSKHINLFTPA